MFAGEITGSSELVQSDTHRDIKFAGEQFEGNFQGKQFQEQVGLVVNPP